MSSVFSILGPSVLRTWRGWIPADFRRNQNRESVAMFVFWGIFSSREELLSSMIIRLRCYFKKIFWFGFFPTWFWFFVRVSGV